VTEALLYLDRRANRFSSAQTGCVLSIDLFHSPFSTDTLIPKNFFVRGTVGSRFRGLRVRVPV